MNAPCKLGDRVRLLAPMADPYTPLPAVLEGTVDWIGQFTSELTSQVSVKWDNGSSLILLPGDRWEVVR